MCANMTLGTSEMPRLARAFLVACHALISEFDFPDIVGALAAAVVGTLDQLKTQWP
jgi:hypothetical protein